MMDDVVVEARVSEEVREKAEKVLADMGLTVADAMRLTLDKIAREETFECTLSHEPNEETVAVLEKAERGEDIVKAKDLDDLFRQLRI
jgi:addiction module RelB/DinJ family antitoxin